jgi:hypothetical protein
LPLRNSGPATAALISFAATVAAEELGAAQRLNRTAMPSQTPADGLWSLPNAGAIRSMKIGEYGDGAVHVRSRGGFG